MATNNFRPKKYYDHVIVDNHGKVVGTVRVKPSGIHWSPTNAKKWYAVDLVSFAAFMEKHGTRKVH
jgi:hypothetical protein